MQIPILFSFIFLCLVWLSGITFFLLKQRKQQAFFTRGEQHKTLSDVLNSLTKDIELDKAAIRELIKKSRETEEANMLNLQKIGLMRFNPFKDTGGEQSFVLALLDAKDSGIVVSALYSRSGTRWYAKKVVTGTGVDFELSEDEQKAIRLAKHSKKP